jgi:hypothetical protein
LLNLFFEEMYEHANSKTPSEKRPTWLEVQDLALKGDENSFEQLSKLVSEAERTCVKLPVIRTAMKDRDFTDTAGEQWSVNKGDVVILDLVSPRHQPDTLKADGIDAVSREHRGHKGCHW